MASPKERATEGRRDLSRFVVHLTRNDTRDFSNGATASKNFRSIVEDRRIIAAKPHCLHADRIPSRRRSLARPAERLCPQRVATAPGRVSETKFGIRLRTRLTCRVRHRQRRPVQRHGDRQGGRALRLHGDRHRGSAGPQAVTCSCRAPCPSPRSQAVPAPRSAPNHRRSIQTHSDASDESASTDQFVQTLWQGIL